jgi:uncharacterized protein YndB with AHSA1/START domain
MTETIAESDVEPVQLELTLTRFYDAPRELVYQMWTDPVHLALWWGPRSFTNPVCQVDVQAGGTIRIIMRAPDGTRFPMSGTYRQVEPPRSLGYTFIALDDDGNPVLDGETAVTFDAMDGKTKLTVQTCAIGLMDGAQQMIDGMENGWSQSLDRLDALLASVRPLASGSGVAMDDKSKSAADREICLSRLFNAPRDVVFDAWTDPEHVSKWWAPQGLSSVTSTMDIKPGGVWRFVMNGPDGLGYQNAITYVEIIKPLRLVYQHEGEDASAPVRFQVTLIFNEQPGDPQRTRLDMQMLFPTSAAREAVIKKYGAIEGAKQMLHRLEEYLTTM